ncbi:MAG: glycosyl hydrolase family 18 protein [Chloroflexota bacterium]|nr:glycosyl hydrolase family 18 protein [Chloroflexota bacterium]
MHKRVRFTALILVILLVPLGYIPSAKAAMGVRWGYYVGYDRTTSLPSLRAHVRDLTHVAPWYGYYIDSSADLVGSGDPQVTDLIRSAGAKVLPMVQNRARYADFHRLISAATTRAKMVSAISGMVTAGGYHGVHIDFEGLNATDRPYLTSFVAELYDALHSRGKLLTMALPAKSYDATTGWAGAYDYARLAPHADLFVIMAYDYHSASSSPGPIAPVSWVRECATYALSQLGRNKLVVGLPLYGYDWDTTSGGKATSVKYPDVARLVSLYGATLGYDSVSQSATAAYTKEGHSHRVWYENARSFDSKLAAVRGVGAAGVGVWRLGQ